MMYTEGEISSLRKSLGIAEAKKLASEEAAKDADARVALLMKRIEEESVEVRNKVSSESFRSAELIASLKVNGRGQRVPAGCIW